MQDVYKRQRFSKTRKSCGLITGKEWLQFFCVPVFTVVGFILMFYSENDDMQNVFLFLSVGLVAINLILMEFMQNTIEKEERIKIAVLTKQNHKNRIADYQDREEKKCIRDSHIGTLVISNIVNDTSGD